MLLQGALLFFTLFGIAALAVDTGLMRLTQLQMQGAADAAALEGIRFRNRLTTDGYASDCIRRSRARLMIEQTFANPTAGDTRQFGAGPVVEIRNGVGAADALAELVPPDSSSGTYRPDRFSLALNQGNVVHGDMVSGVFTGTLVPGPEEDAAYTRQDFLPNPDPPNPGLSLLPGCPDPDDPEPWTAPISGAPMLADADSAFLVRLRRTQPPAPTSAPALDTEAGVSSSGPTLPLLFGRGTALRGAVRHDGFAVRATAIAAVAPVLRVGAEITTSFGAAPFALPRACFESLTTTAQTFAVDAAAGTIDSCGGAEPGVWLDPLLPFLTTVGEPVPALGVAVACAPFVDGIAFVPVFDPTGASAPARRVLGFGRVHVTWDCSTTLQLWRDDGFVATDNATAIVAEGLPVSDLTAAEVAALLTANRALRHGMLAPALVR